MKVTYDSDADAMYIYLNSRYPRRVDILSDFGIM